MRTLIVILIYFIICFSLDLTTKANQTNNKNLERKYFLRLVKSDIKNATKVIADSDLVLVLSHLQTQDKGGDKYYLLEKETIDSMNKSVTEGLYKDLILINTDGIVVYTLSNKSIFSKNVNDLPKNSPYYRCFVNSLKENACSSLNDSGYLYFSTILTREKEVTGILILQVREINKKLLKFSNSIQSRIKDN